MLLGLFRMLFRAASRVVSVISAVVRTVVSVVRYVVRSALTVVRQVSMRAGNYDARWDYILFKHINWRRALLGQSQKDDERDRLRKQLGDKDNNGIPDLYDREVTTPAQDFLGIKYPDTLLRENDYVRYMPRRLGAIPQPVGVGGKGLVRSETLNNVGQIVLVKWNALNPRGRLDAPLYPCNAMDLHVLGHVFAGGQLTR